MTYKADSSLETAELTSLLPGYNCGACGEKRCDAFAEKLRCNMAEPDKCVHLHREQFTENLSMLTEILSRRVCDLRAPTVTENVTSGYAGLIDGYAADIGLQPLPGEPSCREVLFPFSRKEIKAGDIIKYRPLGCPITHFARILEENDGLITVHMTGPLSRLGQSGLEVKDIGICMVGGFEGIFTGKPPEVGQTVRFVPHHCMMGKVHSGVVVQCVGNRIIIEGIDLKVWALPMKKEVYTNAEWS